MSDSPAVEPHASTSLDEQLEQITEALLVARTQDQVLNAFLRSTLAALNAVAGVVLLIDSTGRRLQVAATERKEEGTRRLWQEPAPGGFLPAWTALEQRRTLVFEHPGMLAEAYPELEARLGATAVLPMFLGEQPLGSLVLDFGQPRTFTAEEQRLLRMLAAQCALALSRVQALDSLQASEQSFRRLTEISPVGVAVGSLDGRLSLANDAWLQLLGFTRTEYEAGEINWQNFTPPEYGDVEQRAFETVLTQGGAAEYDKEMLTRAGEPIPLRITLARVDDRQVVGYALDLRPFQRESVRLEQLVAERTEALKAEQEASQAFMVFTEAASQTTNVEELTRLALEVLQEVLPGSSVGFYERKDTHWRAQQLTTDLEPELRDYLQRGLPLDIPVFAEMVRTGAPVFIDQNRQEDGALHGNAYGYGRAALYPIVQEEEIGAALTLGLQGQGTWSNRERGVVLAVGRSFSLLYDRIAAAQEAQAQRAEAEGRGRVLQLLGSLTTEMTSQQGRLDLIRRAQEQVLSLLHLDHAAYWEPEGDSWRLRVHVDDVGHPELTALMHGGFPVGSIPTLDQPWQTGEALYQDGTDVGTGMTTPASAVAALSIGRGRHRRGVIHFTSFQPHQWNHLERVLLETLAQGLWLALERLEATEQVERQRLEAEQRSRALEAFAVLSRDLAEETDRYALIRRAQEIMLSLLTPGYALYWEQEGGGWKLKSQVGDIGDPALQRLVDEQGLPLDAPALLSTWLTGVPNYQDQYAQGADTPAEMIRHVQAATAFRVEIQNRPVGMLAIGLFDQRFWTPLDRATLETALYSLSLALERAQSVEALKQSNRDLQAANEELEAFTYSASHDLRTPVRHVMGFTELAEKALEPTPNERALQHLKVVRQAATRMTDLIDGMLVLSRSGRQELQVKPVDLNALATQARRDAAAEFGAHPVRWQIAPLPTVRGDPQLLQQVMTNLLSNAVKYSAKREVSEVQVRVQDEGAVWRVSVQDNGVGFDPNYAQKLFGIFQRLHSEKSFTGTGVGLATVKRIVQKHGGQVFAESDGHAGATFSFTLPRQR